MILNLDFLDINFLTLHLLELCFIFLSIFFLSIVSRSLFCCFLLVFVANVALGESDYDPPQLYFSLVLLLAPSGALIAIPTY